MSLRAMTKPAPTPPKPGCGGDAPATATERGRNRRSRAPRAFAREAFPRLAGAPVVCLTILLLSRVGDAKRGPLRLAPAQTSRARQLRVDSSSGGAEGQYDVRDPAQRVDAPIGPCYNRGCSQDRRT